MKRILSLTIALIIVFCLAACREDAPIDTTASVQSTVPTEPTAPTEDMPPSEDTAPSVDTEPTEDTAPSVPDHEHRYIETALLPTCTEDGYILYRCDCGDSYRDNFTQPIGHVWSDWATTKEPTETAEGTAKRVCKNCPASKTMTLPVVIPDHTHVYTEKVTTKATCTAGGIKTFTCSCGHSYTESIPKAPHPYDQTVTPPDCTEGGYTTHTCKNCNSSYTDSRTQPLGHSYTNGKCSRCGDIQIVSQEIRITIRTTKGNTVPGVTVKIYLDGAGQPITGTTDDKGIVKITSPQFQSYQVELSNVPDGLIVKDHYTFTNRYANINLEVKAVIDPNDHSRADYQVGDTMGEFTLTDTDGNTYVLSQLLKEKKLIILDFWYVTCAPCKSEFPYFQNIHDNYEDVALLALDPLDDGSQIIALREELGFTFPMIHEDLGMDKGFGLMAYPTTVFIDNSGTIVYIKKGIFDSEADLLATVERYL